MNIFVQMYIRTYVHWCVMCNFTFVSSVQYVTKEVQSQSPLQVRLGTDQVYSTYYSCSCVTVHTYVYKVVHVHQIFCVYMGTHYRVHTYVHTYLLVHT